MDKMELKVINILEKNNINLHKFTSPWVII